MNDNLQFFERIEETESFSQSQYTKNDIPSHPVERAVLLSYLERHHVQMDVNDVAEFVSSNIGLECDVAEVSRAIDILSSTSEIIKRTENEAYTLNTDKELVLIIQDARTEYLIEEEF